HITSHKSESTHWDHPEMTNLLHDLSTLNAVRFSAYRTAMKLRMLQFRLKLSSTSLKTVHEYLISSAPQSRDATVGVSDVVTWLLDLYPADAPTFDLTLNWLFNVYDIHRTGHFNLLSIKVALMLLSNASLEEKFKKLFELVCDERALMSSTQLSSLLIELMKVPQQLGEDYSFGGLNVQPSVKSCFERAMCDDMIDCDQFLEWTRMEPQSIVWLHVMHRLCAAERSLHQVRCVICKIMPISGIRYRCLKCFNFDMCQNCFFAGSTTKNHKLNHPMQEYSSEATSGDEMRDLKVVLKNKFRSKQYFKKHPRLGYLPVQPSSSETNTIDRILQEEYNQLKLVRSEPSLFCRELSVDTGSEVLNKEDFLRQHKNRLEARIQYLEGHNRQIESTLDQLKQIRFEVIAICLEKHFHITSVKITIRIIQPENMRIVTYTKTPQVEAFVSSYQQNDLYHPPPPFRNSQNQINNSAF
ncbi:hypothetical protein HELRODRAFT_62222, partial [Helobdella robusta]|uniref:ZZ-type domain-containing protein n=1 Tax=Helobdella robusta TaxID=6412 RepID=T1FWX2_HELRO